MTPVFVDVLVEVVRQIVVLALVELTQDPRTATRLACALEGYLDCAEVLSILDVESKGRPVGLHTRHHPRKSGGVFWRAAVDVGLLHPEHCAAHQSTDGGRGWGVRGPHGLVPAYSVHLLGDCVGPEVADVPLLSAVMTIRRLVNMRRQYKLDRAQRARAWRIGVGALRREMQRERGRLSLKPDAFRRLHLGG